MRAWLVKTWNDPKQVDSDEYRAWRLQLARTRLRIAAYFCVAGNIAFAALDLTLYGALAMEFLTLRALMTIIAVLGVLLNARLSTERRQTATFIALVWGTCLPICVMTSLAEGFHSPYYSGLMLVLFGFAILVPVRWRQHAIGQVGVLLVYWILNLSGNLSLYDVKAAVGSSYFLIWTCALATASVILYERLQRGEFSVRRQLESSNEKLLELDRLKSQFFANISHELRTPLTLVIGGLRRLGRSTLPTEAVSTVAAALRNAVGLLYLINELLDLSRFESGRARRAPQPLDLSVLVRQIASNFEHSVRQRIHLQGVGQSVVVSGDPGQLKKVVYNLLSNAVKFSDPQSGEVWVRLRDAGESIELEVEDNGIGIASDNLSRIFDRFMQVDSTATRRYEGSGIGLALVKEIVTQHEGTIRVDSRVGQGSTFCVSLPRCKEPLSDVAVEGDEVLLPVLATPEQIGKYAPHGSSREKPAVLVADDNADMRQYLEQILAPHFEVITASDGQEAFDKAKTRKPDMVLADIMMPHMSGYDLLARLRELEEFKNVPVVFLSALTTTETRLSALETGVDDIISKPFDEDELVMRLHNILALRRQQREMSEVRLNVLRRFLPAPVASRLIESASDKALQSHRAEVTVVFFDLRGFTFFAEEAEPEELMDVLRDYQAKVGRLVDEYGGTLERFTGDSIMVFFNDPLPVPHHPQRALEMAVAACALLPGLQNEWRNRGFTLGVGVGAATGYATLGMVGYERRQDYAAIGPVTNLAARLCARAESGQILIPERLANLVRDVASLTPVGPFKLKGLKVLLKAYNVTHIRSSRPGLREDS